MPDRHWDVFQPRAEVRGWLLQIGRCRKEWFPGTTSLRPMKAEAAGRPGTRGSPRRDGRHLAPKWPWRPRLQNSRGLRQTARERKKKTLRPVRVLRGWPPAGK